ncbi:MAG: 23S rRNA (guanosine(2251)-2'-O)-methyltransferase RlmB [Chloroflexota bacterium]
MTDAAAWIWGRHSVLEALKASTVRELWLAEGRQQVRILDEIRTAAANRGVPVRNVSPGEIERIAPGQNTQGVVALVEHARAMLLPDLLATVTATGNPGFLLALDQVQDPQNLGSLLRTASAAGVHGVVVPERRSATRSGVVAKVSVGAASHVPVVEATNFSRALNEIREAGIWVVGLDGEALQTLFTVDLTEPVALVVGSEGAGMRRLTRQHCDFIAKLPVVGPIGSLNAAVAGAIAMYEVVRQRQRLE